MKRVSSFISDAKNNVGKKQTSCDSKNQPKGKEFFRSKGPKHAIKKNKGTKKKKNTKLFGKNKKKLSKISNISSQPQISAYKRVATLPTSWTKLKFNRFVTPSDNYFEDILNTSYKGFAVEGPENFSCDFHQNFSTALLDLETKGFFQFDYTQPLGGKLAKTFVTRCLVGDAGTTYKYLGIRMFSHPWDANDCPSITKIGDLNKVLVERTKSLLNQSGLKVVGPYEYNLTLINRCFPVNGHIKLKNEPMFQSEKCTVSWHADSTLQHYSSIAVYHCSFPDNDLMTADPDDAINDDVSWSIALRVSHNAEGPSSGKPRLLAVNSSTEIPSFNGNLDLAPPLAVPLLSRSAYFLLDDFNHHHQHSVLAGTSHRFASTHRVCRTEGHTLWSVQSKCKGALQGSGASAKQLRSEQLALNDVEFEWIRQYFVQGSRHHDLHVWWHDKITELLDFWRKLEDRTSIAIRALTDAADGIAENVEQATHEIKNKQKKALAKHRKRVLTVEIKSYDVMVEGLEERLVKRIAWISRQKDPIFETASKECRPMKIPFPKLVSPHHDVETRVLWKDNQKYIMRLQNQIAILKAARGRFEMKLSC